MQAEPQTIKSSSTFEYNRRKFNFCNDDSQINYENAVQIVDVKKSNEFGRFGNSTFSKNLFTSNSDSDTWKFLTVFVDDKVGTQGKKVRTWISDLIKLGSQKTDLLKKFKKSMASLQDNDAMKGLSGNIPNNFLSRQNFWIYGLHIPCKNGHNRSQDKSSIPKFSIYKIGGFLPYYKSSLDIISLPKFS